MRKKTYVCESNLVQIHYFCFLLYREALVFYSLNFSLPSERIQLSKDRLNLMRQMYDEFLISGVL